MPALVSRKDIATAAVSTTKRRFGNPTGKLKQARVFFSWASANEVQAMPHALNARPTTFTVVASGDATGLAPPLVFAPDPVYWGSRTSVALASDTANSWAEVLIS